MADKPGRSRQDRRLRAVRRRRCASPATWTPAEALRRRPAQRDDAFVWVGLHEPSLTGRWPTSPTTYGLHELAVEDAVKAEQRPKLEQFGEIAFLVLRTARYVRARRADRDLRGGRDRPGDALHRAGVRDHRPARRRLPAGPGPRRPRASATSCWRRARGRSRTRSPTTWSTSTSRSPTRWRPTSTSWRPRSSAGRCTGRIQRIYQMKRELVEFKRAVVPLQRPLVALTSSTNRARAQGDPPVLPRRAGPPDPGGRAGQRLRRPAQLDPAGAAGPGHRRPEQRHAQDRLVGRHRRRADRHRRHLRHELPEHARDSSGSTAIRRCSRSCSRWSTSCIVASAAPVGSSSFGPGPSGARPLLPRAPVRPRGGLPCHVRVHPSPDPHPARPCRASAPRCRPLRPRGGPSMCCRPTPRRSWTYLLPYRANR